MMHQEFMLEHKKNIQDKIINNFRNNIPSNTDLPFTVMGTQRSTSPYWPQANLATFDPHLRPRYYEYGKYDIEICEPTEQHHWHPRSYQ